MPGISFSSPGREAGVDVSEKQALMIEYISSIPEEAEVTGITRNSKPFANDVYSVHSVYDGHF